MIRETAIQRRRTCVPMCVASCLAWAALAGSIGWAEPQETKPVKALKVFSRDAAVAWALEHNPELAAIRQQRGVAAAGVIIAHTYPFNPVWEGKVRGATGPSSAGVTNSVANEHNLLLELEVRGQGQYRRQGAYATLSRTEWEIAFQEQTLAARVIRAFDGMLYRQEKLRLIEETIRLNEEAREQVAKLADQNRLRPADLILANTEIEDSRIQRITARAALTTARQELRRTLGAVAETVELTGSLELSTQEFDEDALTEVALQRRGDLHARESAVQEADARVRLAHADRFGNPTIGLAYEYDSSRTSLIGTQFSVPLPVLNKRRGEIMERQAVRDRAAAELRQAEVQIRQDVKAAIDRLEEARGAVNIYTSKILPNLRTNLNGIEQLFSQGDPGVDVLRIIDVRRKVLKARDGYLDAGWELRQSLSDLAAATGSPVLAVGESADVPEPKGGKPLTQP